MVKGVSFGGAPYIQSVKLHNVSEMVGTVHLSLSFLSHPSRGVNRPPQGCSLTLRPCSSPTTWGIALNSQPGTAKAAASTKDMPINPKKNSVKRKMPQARGRAQALPYATRSAMTRASATGKTATCGHLPQLRENPTITKSGKYHQAAKTPIQYPFTGMSELIRFEY